MNLEQYLQIKQLSPSTIKSYHGLLKVYFAWLKDEGREGESITYSDLLEYVKNKREKGDDVDYLRHQLSAIRYYYNYLKYTGKIKNNPASGLYIRGKKRTVPHDLLTAGQLEEMYSNYNPKGLSGKRNKTMLGLLVYQGLQTAELELLEPCHLKLRQGKIEVPGTRRSNGRILSLEAHQMLELQEYVSKTRTLILEVTEKETEKLFTSVGDGQGLHNSIDKLMRELRKKHKPFINAQQLRQSRIALWIKQYDIRQVQYMAGHKYVSSTERYQSTNLEDLQKELEKHHPGNR